jgi:hypothetical protein
MQQKLLPEPPQVRSQYKSQPTKTRVRPHRLGLGLHLAVECGATSSESFLDSLSSNALGQKHAGSDLGPTEVKSDLGKTQAKSDLGLTQAKSDLGPTQAKSDLGPTRFEELSQTVFHSKPRRFE